MPASDPKRAALQTLSDVEGQILFGWLDDRVLHARFFGGCSAALGTRYAERLSAMVRAVPSLAYFSDCSAMTSYDLLARSAFTRIVLEHRHKFTNIVMLTWSAGITESARAFVSAVGEPVTLLDDDREFRSQLTRAVPLALPRLHKSAPEARSTLTPHAPPRGSRR